MGGKKGGKRPGPGGTKLESEKTQEETRELDPKRNREKLAVHKGLGERLRRAEDGKGQKRRRM